MWLDINMILLKESWEAYSFFQNCEHNCKISDALVFFNFFCRIDWYCFWNISKSNVPLCLKLHTEVSSSVIFTTPHVWAEFVTPIGTYESFPRVTYFKTVQLSKLVQTSMCHCFTFGFWNFYHRNYGLCPIFEILWNFIWTFIAWDITNIPRCPF